MSFAFLSTLLVAFALITIEAQQETDISSAVGVVQRGYVVPSDTLTKYLYFPTASNQLYNLLNFTLFPCYGSLKWYLDIGRPVIPDNQNSCAFDWDPNLKKTWCAPATYNGTRYNILVQGLRTYSGFPLASAKFDMAIFLTATSYDEQVPVPGGSGKLDGALLDNLKKGDRQQLTLNWIGTGNANDAYTIYQHDNGANPVVDNPDSGYLLSSGCGLKDFMTPVAGIDIQNNNNEFSAVIGDLDPEKDYLFAVVVERNGGYLNSYKTLRVNDSPMKTYSSLVIAFCILISMFAKWM